MIHNAVDTFRAVLQQEASLPAPVVAVLEALLVCDGRFHPCVAAMKFAGKPKPEGARLLSLDEAIVAIVEADDALESELLGYIRTPSLAGEQRVLALANRSIELRKVWTE